MSNLKLKEILEIFVVESEKIIEELNEELRTGMAEYERWAIDGIKKEIEEREDMIRDIKLVLKKFDE